MTTVRLIVLVLATVATGSLAGLYGAFSYAVVPGLDRTDDRTFVTSMQAMNAAILNGWFALVFAGAPIASVAAVALTAGQGGPVLAWTVAGGALTLSTVVVTGVVNVPLNQALDRVPSDGDPRSMAVARRRFARPWLRANTARAVAATLATACLAWAAVLAGP